MKIMHVLTYLDENRSYGGPVTVALNLANEQTKQGHEVAILALAPRSFMDNQPPNTKLSQKLFVSRKLGLKFAFSRLVSVEAVIWAYRNFRNYDVIHLHFSRDLFQSLIGLVSIKSGKRVVVQPHGMLTNSEAKKKNYEAVYDKIFTNAILRKSSSVIALQEQERSGLLDKFNVSNISVIPNGIEFVDSRISANRKNQIVFISRLHPQKQPLMFIQAAKRLHTQLPNTSFIVAGPDGGLSDQVSLIINKTSTKWMSFFGPIPNDRVLAILGESQLLVLPSVEDPYPMVVLEALSCGTNVVVSDTNGLAPELRQHKLGAVFDSTEDGLVKTIMEALVMDVSPHSRWVKAREIFSIGAVAKRFEKIYGSYNQEPGGSGKDILKCG